MAVVYAMSMKRGVTTELGLDGEGGESDQVGEPTLQRSRVTARLSTTAVPALQSVRAAVPPAPEFSLRFGLRTTGVTGLPKHQLSRPARWTRGRALTPGLLQSYRRRADAQQDAQRLSSTAGNSKRSAAVAGPVQLMVGRRTPGTAYRASQRKRLVHRR